MGQKKIGIMVSGRGTNMQALIDASKDPDYPARVELVISNREKAPALEKAHKENIKAVFVSGIGREWEQKALNLIKEHELELLCLAGFMKILSPAFLNQAPPVMNIHPSLLPSFPGLNAQKQALDYGVKVSGCTVHFVDSGIDSGPVILQEAVEVKTEDEEKDLADRILKTEHRLYPKAVKLWAGGKLEIKGRKVELKEENGHG